MKKGTVARAFFKLTGLCQCRYAIKTQAGMYCAICGAEMGFAYTNPATGDRELFLYPGYRPYYIDPSPEQNKGD